MNSFLEKLKKGMGIEEEKIEEKPKEEKVELKKKKILVKEKKENWLEPEGQLMIDFYQTEEELVLISPIAGVKTEDLDIEVEGDTLTIKGERKNPSPEGVDFFTKECYWGKFFRQVILPAEIDPNRIEASFKAGILKIRLPKLFKEKKRKIIPKE